jgi:hypothetical protein
LKDMASLLKRPNKPRISRWACTRLGVRSTVCNLFRLTVTMATRRFSSHLPCRIASLPRRDCKILEGAVVRFGSLATERFSARAGQCPLFHPPIDGVIGRPACRSLEIVGAALQADGETRSAFAASSIRRRSVSHGPFCRTRRFSQGDQRLHCG